MLMHLTIVNISETIKMADFEAVVAAIDRQVQEHLAPEWNISARLRCAKRDLKHRWAPIAGLHDAIIYVGDSAQDSTTGVVHAYGYHSENAGDIPYGFVYLDVCEKRGEAWTCTLSHEVLELLVDPSAALTVCGPAPRNSRRTVYYDLEICDPAMGDTYVINKVEVSNFVTRAYFGMPSGHAATNFLKLRLRPFSLRPGGYLQYEDKGKAQAIFGKKAGAKAARAKLKRAHALMEGHRRNSRRSARLYRRSARP